MRENETKRRKKMTNIMETEHLGVRSDVLTLTKSLVSHLNIHCKNDLKHVTNT